MMSLWQSLAMEERTVNLSFSLRQVKAEEVCVQLTNEYEERLTAVSACAHKHVDSL